MTGSTNKVFYMSKARELIEAIEMFNSSPEAVDEAAVIHHDSHYGKDRKIGYTKKLAHNGHHVAYHTAYPDSHLSPRDMGSFKTEKEAEEQVRKTHNNLSNLPKYKHWYKKNK